MARISTISAAAMLVANFVAGDAWSAEVSASSAGLTVRQPISATVLITKQLLNPADLVGLNPQPEPPSRWRLIRQK